MASADPAGGPCGSLFAPVAMAYRWASPASGDLLGVHAGARALNSQKIGPVPFDSVETEAPFVAVAPLEIVEERPVKIAAHVDPCGAGAVERRETRTDELRAEAVGCVGDAVLRHDDGKPDRGALSTRPLESLGVNLPAEVAHGCTGA